jgi:hypothetical protein
VVYHGMSLTQLIMIALRDRRCCCEYTWLERCIPAAIATMVCCFFFSRSK